MVMENNSNVIDWKLVIDKDLPAEKMSTHNKLTKRENYFYIPANETCGLVNSLCSNCLVVYALLTTAAAMHPKVAWHNLPQRQREASGLDRYQIGRAIKVLEAAGLVEKKRQDGHKNLYRLTTRRNANE
jgi:DNA-binding transcriptional ArsR family regulator